MTSVYKMMIGRNGEKNYEKKKIQETNVNDLRRSKTAIAKLVLLILQQYIK